MRLANTFDNMSSHIGIPHLSNQCF